MQHRRCDGTRQERVAVADASATKAPAPRGERTLACARRALAAAKAEKRARIHSFHRYFGKLIPAIPRFAIREFTKPGDLVLDPFCGSGTTLVEAVLAGRRAIGVDLNPLAVLVATAKTAPLDIAKALRARDRVLAACERDSVSGPSPSQGEVRVRVGRQGRAAPLPFLPNMDHWFRPHVQRDLALLLARIRRVRDGGVRTFLLACFSAMLRDVSNADPRHVFPGYSKRLRAVDAAGGRRLAVFETFRKVTGQRAAALGELAGCAPGAALCADSRRLPLPDRAADLIVTNPPYISSIRYLETMKLEMYWLGFVESREAYLALDRRVTGTERLRAEDTLPLPGRERAGVRVGLITRQLTAAGHPKMAAVVARYFTDMAAALAEMARVLRPGGHLVMKISDSHVRGVDVPTHDLLAELAAERGLRLIEQFTDEIRSRSLLTKRNWYSGMIAHDWILILRRS